MSYSQRTAGRLIQFYEEYGPNSPDGQSSLNQSLVTNLTYTQAVLLLGLSEEEREEFLAQNDVAGMTKQELQQALRDRDQAKQEKELALQENEVLKQGLELIDSTISELKKEQAKASVSNNTPASNTSLPTHNLQTEINPNAAAKYVERCNSCCKTISATFFELTTALTNLAHLDAKLKEEKRKEAQKLLETIAETIKEWPPAKKPLKVIH